MYSPYNCPYDNNICISPLSNSCPASNFDDIVHFYPWLQQYYRNYSQLESCNGKEKNATDLVDNFYSQLHIIPL